MFGRKFFFVILLGITSLPLLAQTLPADQALKIGSKEVLLDVIARDKRGRNVRDLKPEEIEVYEDGVRQSILSLRLIETESQTPQTDAATNAKKNNLTSFPIDPARPINTARSWRIGKLSRGANKRVVNWNEPSGEWFPAVIRMNADGDGSAFYGLNWDVVFEFTSYQEFNIRGAKDTAPAKQP